ncbi:MAG: PEP/pyruvate-binding domain-containing protein [Pseudomonadota bacterium]
MPPSKALEVNLKTSRVDVVVDSRFQSLRDITAPFLGLQESLTAFLREVCHPYKNWRFIVTEARRFAFHNFHIFKDHPLGPEGSRLFMEIFLDAARLAKIDEIKADAVDNLLAYLLQIINEAGPELERFKPGLDFACQGLVDLPDEIFQFAARSFYPPHKIARDLIATRPADDGLQPLADLLGRSLDLTYSQWLAEASPDDWFQAESGENLSELGLDRLFAPLSHPVLKKSAAQLALLRAAPARVDSLKKMAELPGNKDLVAAYEQLPRTLARSGRDQAEGDRWKLLLLFHLMDLAGLAPVQERLLREVNQTLGRLLASEGPGPARALIDKTFKILGKSSEKYPQTTFNLLYNMGLAVYGANRDDMVEAFIASVIGLGFQTPDLGGVGDDWQIRVNTAHIQNIRSWLQLAGLKPRWSKKLLSALVVHLALAGVFIKDTDLFPRDITALLNSDVRPVYNLVKQLCRLFPTYFNEIGAEGRLRDISTQIDELCRRGDPLIHYLRKQSHVESSPQTVVLMEAIFEFWRTADKAPLAALVPPDIFARIEEDGEFTVGPRLLTQDLFRQGLIGRVRDLLTLPRSDLTDFLARNHSGIEERERLRLEAAHELYQKLHWKYNTDLADLGRRLDQLQPEFLPGLDSLKKILTVPDKRERLLGLLDHLESLRETILSPEAFEAREDIYYKRHIAVDIPSMYGSYHERKFDALGLTFRLESQVNILFQELLDEIDLKLITRATLVKIQDLLLLFNRALKLDGIHSQELEKQLDLLGRSLNIRGFSFTQYLDIFRGFSQSISNIVNDHFNNVHQAQLLEILDRTGAKALLPKFASREAQPGARENFHRIGEIFLRDRIASSLGLQQLDQFIARIQTTVFQQDHELSQDMLRRLLNFDPDNTVTDISPAKKDIADIIYLGAKGLGLVKLTNLGLPVPKGFILTTEVFRCRDVIEVFEPAREEYQGLVTARLRELERAAGKKFGDPANPLLLSVRSGSSISQPGMMNTFLNVGLNEEITAGLAGGGPGRVWFAWDCFRRFLQNYGMARGLERDPFDSIMSDLKNKFGLPYKKDFSGTQMMETARAYKDFILSRGIAIEDRPLTQLFQAINGVFQSWESERARTYRRIMGISDDWGTAVTVQGMVFGNLSRNTGAGVVFTHNPRWSGDELFLWGDFALGNQGEDVVSGLVETIPVSLGQAEEENRSRDLTLETHFPLIYGALLDTARKMINSWGFGPQEMEFTFEGPQASQLYILQTRDMTQRERPQEDSLDFSAQPLENFLGQGIGVGGKGMSGRIVFDRRDIDYWRGQEPGSHLILIRGDTVPDDIKEIFETDGLLTARGGSTSHAAIVANRLNKTCIVGFSGLLCDEKSKTCRLGATALASGDWISMDGLKGQVYKGRIV